MNIILSILAGIFFAYFANYILDYLPYQRGFTGKKLRTFTITGRKESFVPAIYKKFLPSPEKVFYSVSFPFCQHCLEKVSWKNYLLGSKCIHCGAVVNRRFWLLLIGLPLIFAIITLYPIAGFRVADLFLMITFYIIVIFMDMEHRVILGPVTFIGILFGLYFGFSYHTFINTLLGGFVGGGIMVLFYWVGILYIRFVRRTSNPNMYEVALGFGDVTLSLILGFILGWPGIIGGLFLGILLGGVISGGLLLVKFVTKKYAPNDLILPYAPFLVIGAFLIMIM